MKRRLLGIIVAAALATLGTAALVAYVRSAKDKAVASEQLVDVYVVDKHVPLGANAAAIRSAVRLEKVPARLKQPDAIDDLADLGTQVTTAELQPADQLIKARLGSTDKLLSTVPADKLAISVALDPERTVGGTVRPGDLVGVFLSFEPFDTEAPGQTAASTTAAPKKSPNMTHLQFQKVLVTGVQLASATNNSTSITPSSEGLKKGDELPTAPQQKLIVTLALSPPDAEQLVFAAEFGKVWLASEAATVSEDGTRIVTLGNVYAVKTK